MLLLSSAISIWNSTFLPVLAQISLSQWFTEERIQLDSRSDKSRTLKIGLAFRVFSLLSTVHSEYILYICLCIIHTFLCVSVASKSYYCIVQTEIRERFSLFVFPSGCVCECRWVCNSIHQTVEKLCHSSACIVLLYRNDTIFFFFFFFMCAIFIYFFLLFPWPLWFDANIFSSILKKEHFNRLSVCLPYFIHRESTFMRFFYSCVWGVCVFVSWCSSNDFSQSLDSISFSPTDMPSRK